MKIRSLADVKAHLSAYVREAVEGPVVITRNGRPVAVLLAVDDQRLCAILGDQAGGRPQPRPAKAGQPDASQVVPAAPGGREDTPAADDEGVTIIPDYLL